MTALSITNNRYVQVLLFVAVTALTWIAIGAPHTYAVGNGAFMPNPANSVSPTGPNDVDLVVATPFTGNSLNAPISRVKIYSLVPNPTIRIYGYGQCSYLTTADHDSNSAAATTYQFFRTTAAEAQSGAAIVSSSNGAKCSAATWLITGFVSFNLSGGVKSTVTGHGSYYVFVFQATMGGGAVNGFKLWTSSGVIGYSDDATDKFALQNRNGQPTEYTNFYLPFAPDCNLASNKVVSLNWYDDDWGTLQTNSNFVFDVVDITTGAVIVNNFAPRLGTGVGGSINITVQPKHKYEWVWQNVKNNNGIQFKLPYDSIFYNTSCVTNPPTGAVSYVCHVVSGTASDPDRPNFALPVRVYDKPIGTVGAQFKQVTTNAVTHAFSVDTWLTPLSANDFAAHSFYVYALNITAAGVQDPADTTPWQPLAGGNPTASQVCAPAVSCGGLNASPSNGESGQPVAMTADVSFSSSAPFPSAPTYLMTFKIVNVSGVTVFNSASVPYTSNASGAISNTINYTPPTPGTYTVTWDFNGPGINIPGCTDTFTISNKPYFQVYGGDASAGADFQQLGVCNSNSGTEFNGIAGFNKGSAGGYAGAGVQVAAIAAGAINEFISDRFNIGPGRPTGISFASNSPVSDPYGGNFDNTQCIPDYWSLAPSVTPTSMTIAGLALPNAPGAGRKDIFVNGDVYISGNIVYTSAGANNWSTDTMPSFRLIVKGGNIYIDNGVTELDGLYVAIPDAGTGGKIYTCALSSSVPTEAQMADQTAAGCGAQQLVVYGSFIADQVKLFRTKNTLANAIPSEPLNPIASNKAAEIFVYTPELWLATPATVPPASIKYDAISSIAPIL